MRNRSTLSNTHYLPSGYLSSDRNITSSSGTTTASSRSIFRDTFGCPSNDLGCLLFAVLNPSEGIGLFEADYTPFFCHPDIVLLFQHPLQLRVHPFVSLHDTAEAFYLRSERNILQLLYCSVELAGILIMPFKRGETPGVVAGAVLLPVVVGS